MSGETVERVLLLSQLRVQLRGVGLRLQGDIHAGLRDGNGTEDTSTVGLNTKLRIVRSCDSYPYQRESNVKVENWDIVLESVFFH